MPKLKSAAPRNAKAASARPPVRTGQKKKAPLHRSPARSEELDRIETDEEDANKFPIVGIGGSAGGFEAMGALLRALPTNTGMAFVLIQHLDPRGTSRYGELLKRETTMPVEEITNGIVVEPNHVYCIPPGAYVKLEGKQLVLTKAIGGEHIRMPIDRFFISLARENRHRAVAVVLSGTNADGTGGLRAIREEGGITFAQSERSSKYFAMPASAIASGCVDSVLAPDQIGTRLGQIAKHPWARTPPAEAVHREETKDPGPVKAMISIFSQLRQHSGVDFTLYKRSTIQRRISRRMVLSRIDRLADYAKLLRTSPGELDSLFDDLLINVTQFFRDRPVFSTLQKRVFPKLLRARRAEDGDLRIWVAGCATGEEVYSLAITALDTMRRLNIDLRVQIFGTDLSEAAINTARAGVYPLSIANDVSPERLKRFFKKTDTSYQVNRSLRDLCTFARQNICQDPPFSRIDLISCRNVLIYLGSELQRRCLPIFHYALSPAGHLLLGSAETVGRFTDLFSLVDKRHRIYAKKMTRLRPAVDFGKQLPTLEPLPKIAPPRREQDINAEIQKEADRLVLQRMVPSGVIIDTQLQVVQFRGSTGMFLEHASGDASLNLLQMVHPSLVVDLRAAIHKATKQNIAVRKEGINFQYRADALLVDLDVVPFKVPAGGSERWLLVLFQTRPAHAAAVPASSGARRGNGRLQPGLDRLRDELRATKESLQAIIEEQEATNEELKSANEEIESSNEELQSSNEELETAKEELQSTNEELQTLNEELNNRNTEISQVNSDLGNLLSSINIPIIMVDGSLTVRRATPLAEKLFNLIPTDIGRRLSDIKPNLKTNDLDHLIRRVIETLETEEREVTGTNGTTYQLRIRPYRTQDNKIDGAVLTLVDIDPIRRPHASIEYLSSAAMNAAENSGSCVFALDTALRIRAGSTAFRETFDLQKDNFIGRSLFDLKGGAWKVAGLREFLQKAVKTASSERRPSTPPYFALPVWSMVLTASAVGQDHDRLLIVGVQKEKKS